MRKCTNAWKLQMKIYFAIEHEKRESNKILIFNLFHCIDRHNCIKTA